MNDARDKTTALDPAWDAAGLVTAVVTQRGSGELLMVAHMNAEAVAATQASGEAHFWSRSRKRLWKKGETSGNVLRVVEMRIDCDQDAVAVDRRGDRAGVPHRRALVFLSPRRGRAAGTRRVRLAIGLMLLLGACQRAPVKDETPGGRLEAAAIARGLVADPTKAGLIGSWAGDTDRLCVVPAGDATRLGAIVDYGDGQSCAASGTVNRDGGELRVRFGACRFDATFDGERITFPAELPAACSGLCSGRASLAALSVERLSESISEAASLRTSRGRTLCAG